MAKCGQHAEIGPYFAACSRWHPQAEAVIEVGGPLHDMHECEANIIDIYGVQEGTKYIKLPWI